VRRRPDAAAHRFGYDPPVPLSPVLETLRRSRAVAVLRTPHAAAAAPALRAAMRGGFHVLEVTLNTPAALERIAELAATPEVVVGAGTVLSPAEAHAAAGAGARFLVSPVFDPEVLEAAQRLGVPLLPGVATPGEALRAHRAGAEVLKLFPPPAGGPAWVRAVLAPLPFLRLVPTSGVDAGNAREWLDAGCFAVGVVKALFDEDDLAGGRFDRVEARARALLAALA
jgi:2-dehydro-3-deoxyphosphogluconate aldolase/(4S)-4-hydroxy-2-oxoglutarate aldolase